MINDSVILITGGTGSFGRTMLQYLLTRGAREIRVFSRDEEKQDRMRSELEDANVRYYIGDVRNRDALDDAMVGVDYIYHAAALKQVPSCEFFPMEAVRTNVIGSANVVDVAIRHKVKRVVCLSTDKAVLPINAMGMSKALMEKIALSKSLHGEAESTIISCVRYGNVMYSRGSVIPRFIDQIKRGVEITITNPDMTRFLLPLRDSVRLVEFAMTNSNPGDLFVKKAPAATIGVLAQALLELFEANNEIKVIGTRHGEKLYETLISSEEQARSEDLGEFYRIAPDNRDLNYEIFFNEGSPEIAVLEDYHSHNTERLNVEQTKSLLLSLPEIEKELELHRAS